MLLKRTKKYLRVYFPKNLFMEDRPLGIIGNDNAPHCGKE
ncbi:hypothetical protein CLFO_14300 [Clostridium formicaceticum]|uniref:Uncharacterized protein n=1 Tax=Clostridium formicaceticum TaxID=1497 RepID=A0AAC9WFU0_9CLOT|nr:hypothetical protein CLFO_14300 [Clostridium formicaceticum]